MTAASYRALVERLTARGDSDSLAAAAALEALTRETLAVVQACRAGRWYEAGPGGMSVEAQIARTLISGVRAAPVVELEDTLSILSSSAPEMWREYLIFAR